MTRLNQDGILTITEEDFGSRWAICFDLVKIAAAAGVREKKTWKNILTGRTNTGYQCDLPLTKARKMIQFMRRYITEEEAKEIDRIFKSNAKLYNIWRAFDD